MIEKEHYKRHNRYKELPKPGSRREQVVNRVLNEAYDFVESIPDKNLTVKEYEAKEKVKKVKEKQDNKQKNIPLDGLLSTLHDKLNTTSTPAKEKKRIRYVMNVLLRNSVEKTVVIKKHELIIPPPSQAEKAKPEEAEKKRNSRSKNTSKTGRRSRKKKLSHQYMNPQKKRLHRLQKEKKTERKNQVKKMRKKKSLLLRK